MDRSNYMRNQEKVLGVSADWEKELFTLDPKLNSIVYKTFEKLWNDDLVYKGSRIVNWSVESNTALSDVEVEYREQKGNLWYFYYPFQNSLDHPEYRAIDLDISYELPGENDERYIFIEDQNIGLHSLLDLNGKKYLLRSELNISDLEVTNKQLDKIQAIENVKGYSLLPYFNLEKGLLIATTRPETLLGDSALAVHPSDERYKHLIGKEIKVPLQDRYIKVIADKRVELTYGTGVIKITPAHDFLDYDIGKDHQLEILQVIGTDGKMTSLAGDAYIGLESMACREKVVKDLEERGLLESIVEMKHKVPISERAKDIIQPLVSKQWFVNVDKEGKSLKENALKALREDKINIYPKRFKKLFIQWLENLRDWNVSRQIWWGHQMPVWYKDVDGNQEIFVGEDSPGEGWERETDTFDTWFSSGQWAFSTLAAHGVLDLENPENSKEFPSHTMVMGRDILFFWACRMLLLTMYRLDDIPWKNIYFTGLIRDEKGQKMSKSKNNGIEPREIIDDYGVDALRLSLIVGTSPGNDINFGYNKLAGYSKFMNKLWNSSKLIELKFAGVSNDTNLDSGEFKLDISKWIIFKLNNLVDSYTEKINNYEYSKAIDELYGFTWFTFCDWYLEMFKSVIDNGTEAEKAELMYVTKYVFKTLLQLLHPYIPFITEEIYQKLELVNDSKMLANSTILKKLESTPTSMDLETAISIISDIRSKKAAIDMSTIRMEISTTHQFSSEIKGIIKTLARVDFVESIATENALTKTFGDLTIVYGLADKSKYKSYLEKELNEKKRYILILDKKLNSSFVDKADPEIVEQEKKRLKEFTSQIKNLETEWTQFN